MTKENIWCVLYHWVKTSHSVPIPYSSQSVRVRYGDIQRHTVVDTRFMGVQQTSKEAAQTAAYIRWCDYDFKRSLWQLWRLVTRQENASPNPHLCFCLHDRSQNILSHTHTNTHSFFLSFSCNPPSLTLTHTRTHAAPHKAQTFADHQGLSTLS